MSNRTLTVNNQIEAIALLLNQKMLHLEDVKDAAWLDDDTTAYNKAEARAQITHHIFMDLMVLKGKYWNNEHLLSVYLNAQIAVYRARTWNLSWAVICDDLNGIADQTNTLQRAQTDELHMVCRKIDEILSIFTERELEAYFENQKSIYSAYTPKTSYLH